MAFGSDLNMRCCSPDKAVAVEFCAVACAIFLRFYLALLYRAKRLGIRNSNQSQFRRGLKSTDFDLYK